MKAGFEQFLFAGQKRAIPSGQDRPFLPARVANQNTGFASSELPARGASRIIIVIVFFFRKPKK